DHFAWPSGGAEHVRAMSRASASPSKVIGRADFGLSLRDMQSSKPVSTSRCLVRETLALLVSSASMICSSVHPSPASETSALSRIRARVTNSAERRAKEFLQKKPFFKAQFY